MPNVEKISIALTAEMAGTLRDAVNSGEYVSTSEVVREALREWKLRHLLRRDEIEELRKSWQNGIDSGPGRFTDMDAIKAEARLRRPQNARTKQVRQPNLDGMPKIEGTALAEADLIDIRIYVSQDNPDTADRLLDDIEATCLLLAEHPQLGVARPEIGNECRLFPVGRYLIPYRMIPRGIEGVRVSHGARRLDTLIP